MCVACGLSADNAGYLTEDGLLFGDGLVSGWGKSRWPCKMSAPCLLYGALLN